MEGMPFRLHKRSGTGQDSSPSREGILADATRNLTEEERSKIAEFINEKATLPGDPCLVCRSLDTRIGHNILLVPVRAPGGEYNFGGGQPVVPVVCHNCGFVRYFHAERLGLVPSTIPPEEE